MKRVRSCATSSDLPRRGIRPTPATITPPGWWSSLPCVKCSIPNSFADCSRWPSRPVPERLHQLRQNLVESVHRVGSKLGAVVSRTPLTDVGARVLGLWEDISPREDRVDQHGLRNPAKVGEDSVDQCRLRSEE